MKNTLLAVLGKALKKCSRTALAITFGLLIVTSFAAAQPNLHPALQLNPLQSPPAITNQMQIQNLQPRSNLVLLFKPDSKSFFTTVPKHIANAATTEAEQSAPSKVEIKINLLSEDQLKQLAKQEFELVTQSHNHTLWQIKHTQATYQRQAEISTWLFWGVALMTVVSLVLCMAQFAQGAGWLGRKAHYKKATSPEGVGELEVAPDKLKLRSNAMGLLLLAMTFAFLYLLVKEVYPITVGP